tara:strand:+ start:191 stop:406 length:216 start_codon:yes stop_codon:yes gene_type:complete
MNNTSRQSGEKKPGLKAIIQSTLAAAFGVQSSKNREQDFQHGNIWVYIFSGILFTVIFIFSVLFLVRLALA